jgi:hypothetical protein
MHLNVALENPKIELDSNSIEEEWDANWCKRY